VAFGAFNAPKAAFGASDATKATLGTVTEPQTHDTRKGFPMSQPTPPRAAADAWRTPAVREAEGALDRSVSRSRQLLKDLAKVQPPPVPPAASPERIAVLKIAASRPDAPPHLKLVKRKVDAGELSWEDVAAGRAFADPEVRALAADRLGDARELYQELREGATPDELLEARTGGRPADPLADTGRSPYPAGPAPAAGYSADDPLHSSEPAGHRPPPPPVRFDPPPPPPAPPARHRAAEPEVDDDFADPLADDDPPKRAAPPRSTRRQDRPGDDDYFGHSPLG
jgi:hypothetical protein